MPDTTDLGGENADGPVNLVPLDQAPGLLLQMISRFAMGLSEPMVIEENGRPVAALISMEDLRRLREYDQQVLDADDSFYFELDQRLHLADTEQTVADLDAFAKSFGPRGDRKFP
ncbi:type II toxin-antitoxin system Phd/YefM family antitoxin [Rhodococcus sp. KRD197]|uniref:type II toxin-antitoxin system Phd/YefM family antitoxin n=1 Tax=Rhodococcus sp. KRD197 TaxID=2729731 RepID=UPI0019CF5ABF|nr:type II toxin-antitoxin system Phd/YefM family antitoxin [Rhodococcus sp. KRD197]